MAFGPFLPILASALFAGVWGPRFFHSFWVDEAGTFWMAHEGMAQALQKTQHWPGQSVLFAMIESWFCRGVPPLRDAMLRIPSLAGIAAATYFLYRIAERAIGHGSGLVASVLFLFHPGIMAVGYQARPYALGIAAVNGSCWALIEWSTHRSRRYLLWHAGCSVLVIYFHDFFSAIFAVHVLYLGYIFLVDRQRYRWPEVVGALGIVVLSILPLAPHLRLLISERHTLPYMAPPSLTDLTDSLAPSSLLAGVLVAGVVLSLICPGIARRRKVVPISLWWLLAAWWLMSTLLFFTASRATSMQIFVPRYLAFSFAAQSLLLAGFAWQWFGGADRGNSCSPVFRGESSADRPRA
jgi:mannosyltransferase